MLVCSVARRPLEQLLRAQRPAALLAACQLSTPSTSLGGGTGATGARKGLGATIMASTQTEDQSFVDTNAERLVNNACINYLKQGEDIELKEDSEYPSWLFELDLSPAPTFDEMHPDTHGWLFWLHYKAEYERQKIKEEHLRLTSTQVQHNARGRYDYDEYRSNVRERARPKAAESGLHFLLKRYRYNK